MTLHITGIRAQGREARVQLQHVAFVDANGMAVPVARVDNPRGDSPGNEQPSNLLRPDNSKWLDGNFQRNGNQTTLVFHLQQPALIAAYVLTTANDVPERDPV